MSTIIPFPSPVAYTYDDDEDDACGICGNWQCTCGSSELDVVPELVAARRDALANMFASGFIDQADLAAVATVADDIEAEDDAAGWEDGPDSRFVRPAVELAEVA